MSNFSPRSTAWSQVSIAWTVTLWLLGCSAVTTHCIGCKSKATSQVIFATDSNKEIKVSVELACNDEERAKGLMYRESLKQNHGMLFVFPFSRPQSFWMKNTYIPLDMIHISADYKIVGIVENATPHSTISRTVGKPARYVLEVNAFFARLHGIQPGQTVKIIQANCNH